ncbi:hypothetical protein [Aeromicrobium sp. UC242_57]|uniref:hypothetical protein n=1 Tax=Aeromicrobium sp. UC242_57 TaxID=3374624 RepID=UPI00379C9E71
MSTILRSGPPDADLDEPRELASNPTGSDRAFLVISRCVAAVVLVITGGIGVFLAMSFLPTLGHYGLASSPRSSGSPRPMCWASPPS